MLIYWCVNLFQNLLTQLLKFMQLKTNFPQANVCSEAQDYAELELVGENELPRIFGSALNPQGISREIFHIENIS